MKFLDSFHLKLIAIITMVIDHIGYVFFPSEEIFRIIGRIAFFLFAFMIAEGMVHSKNVVKYKGRLLLFALLSEIPHDLLFYNKWLEFEHQNIFFTLFLSAFLIYLLRKPLSLLHKSLVILSALILSTVGNLEYGIYGLLLIVNFYFIKDCAIKTIIAQLLSTFAVFIINILQFWAGLGIVPLLLYNGKKGINTGKIFYYFYPFHLSVLYIVKILIN